jgi:hypothetical protein
MDRSRGMICGLTNEYPDFEGECELFVEDFKVTQKKVEKEREQNVKKTIEVENLQTPVLGHLSMNQLALLVGICTLLFLIQGKILLATIYNDNPGFDFSYMISIIIAGIPFLFLGLAINNLKHGIIAAFVYSIINYAIYKLGLVESGFNSLVIILWFMNAAGVLAFIVSRSFRDKNKIILFGLLGAAIFTGFQLIYSGFLDFDRVVDFLFNRQKHDETRFSFNFLDFEFEKSEFQSRSFHFKSMFLGVFKMIPIVLILVALYNQLKMNRKWNDFVIDLGKKINPIVFLFFVIGSYILLVLFATAIIDSTMKYFSSGSAMSMEIGNNFFIGMIKILFYTSTSIFAFWYYTIWFRKKTMEFFTSYNLPISYIYFFSMLPVVGLVIWIFLAINLMSSNQSEEKENEPIKVLDHKSIFTVYFSVVAVFFVIRMMNSRHPEYFVDSMVDLLLFAVFFAVFYLKKLGVYASFALRIILVFVSLYYMLVSSYLAAQFAVSQFTLWALLFGGAFHFLIHPLIHLKHYKVYRLIQNDLE